MSSHQETNPHFTPPPRRQRPLRHKQYEYPQRMPMPMPTPHSPPSSPPHRAPHRQQYPPSHSPPSSPPHRAPHRQQYPSAPDVPPPSQRRTRTPLPRGRQEDDHFPLHPLGQLPSTHPGPDHLSHHPLPPSPDNLSHHPLPPSPERPSPRYSNIRIPPAHKTKPHTWLIGAFCAIFWIAVVLGGLVVLVVYLLFRPRSPKFDIAEATLNAAYLDMGYLLNADMTILANFTNPSKKATVDFTYMYVKVYFEHILISTTYVEPFKEMKAVSGFRTIHLVSSQVGLPLRATQKMTQQIEGNRIRFQVEASMRTRSNLGGLFRYKYWLFGHCLIEVTGPPSGVLVGKLCKTKR